MSTKLSVRPGQQADESFGLSIVPKPIIKEKKSDRAVTSVAHTAFVGIESSAPGTLPPGSPPKAKLKPRAVEYSPQRSELAKRLTGVALAAMGGMKSSAPKPGVVEPGCVEPGFVERGDTGRVNPFTGRRTGAYISRRLLLCDEGELPTHLSKPAVTITKMKLKPKVAAAPKIEMYKLFGTKGFDREFYGYAKALSTNQRLGFMQFKRDIYTPFLDLLRAVEVEETLDFLIHKDAAIGVNKTEEVQAKNEKILNLIDTLMANLESHGIKGVQDGEEINFWSGREGQARAASDVSALSDSDLPAFCFLFECWRKAKQSKEGSRLVGSLMPRLFSYIFSRYAKGVVNVYLASQAPKSGDDKTKLLADSAFWGTELGNLVQNDAVTSVNLHIYDRDAAKFNDPIDLKSADPAVRKLRDELQITVRGGDFAVSVGDLRQYCDKWRTSAVDLGLIPGAQRLDEVTSV
ncbi:MAG: hypothetical protein S4CHLAM37_06050 [Chlamydiia bacterium]|nr:hypothetical protein [Chlamydiia bacterium]